MRLKVIKNNKDHYCFSSGNAAGWGNGHGVGMHLYSVDEQTKIIDYKVRSTEHDNTKRRNKNSRRSRTIRER
jgi:hypothetical protein